MPPGFPLNKDFPINYVSVVVGYKTKNGVEEVVHQLDGDMVRIVSFQHDVQTKTRAVKEDGQVCGYEPTGEETVTIKVKYIRE